MKSGILNEWVVVIMCACAAVAVAEPGRVIYVDAGAQGAKTGSSWADACNCLQDGLALAAAAEKPGEVRVAKGVYKPDQGDGITPGDRTATFKLVNGVTIKGGYPGAGASDPDARDVKLYETILSGDLAGDDDSTDLGRGNNSFRVVTGSGTDKTAVLDGLTVTAGHSAGDASDAELNGRGAGLMIDAGSPTVFSCRFIDNHAWGDGGAVMARNGSKPILTDCEFLRTSGIGLYCLNNSDAVVTNCRFEGNDIFGAMQNWKSSPVITGCQFIDNGRAAVEAHDCNSVLTDCVFQGGDSSISEHGVGSMSQQGIGCYRGHLALTNCTFTDFTGGAIDTWDDLTLVRCTFKNNSGGAVEGSFSGRVTAVECLFAGNRGSMVGAISGGDLELHDCEFTNNSGFSAGAVSASSLGSLIATGCVFSGNSGEHGGAGAIYGHTEVLKLSNCTFIGNRGQSGTIDRSTMRLAFGRLTQCIIRDEPTPFGSRPTEQSRISITYSNVLGGYPGEGNIDVDPCFVDPGHWADAKDLTKEAGPDDPNAIWIAGDYHLKSQAGHWDRASENWVRDDVTSLCIDAGNPMNPLGTEPFPNGGFINIGAYGGSAEASKSYFGKPVCESQLGGDINGDCVVDQADKDILELHWLMEATGLVNMPPTVTLLSPKDGDELTAPEPIVFQATASDSDGTVVSVKYFIEHRTDTGGSLGSTGTSDPKDGWRGTWKWSNVHYDGVHTIWAEAMDNEGTKTASPKIKVMLHPK
jgi:hypothetical protein